MMYDLMALGEVLIDFTQAGVSADGQRLFEQNPGGAVANVLALAANCGLMTAMLGKVGKDMHGAFLRDTLKNAGISTEYLMETIDAFTTLAFVALAESGERTFSFARKPGADTLLREEELPDIRTKVFHIGSLSLTAEPSRTATLTALRRAKEAGAVISYDPNYRAPLWESREAAVEWMRAPLPYVELMKLSDEETELLTGLEAPEDAAKALCAMGIPCVAVTLGAKGALVCVGGKCAIVDGFPANAVDTTGAGDAFWGGFLTQFIQDGKAPAELTLEDSVRYARWANAAASLCVRKRGAIPAMPTGAEVDALLREYGV